MRNLFAWGLLVLIFGLSGIACAASQAGAERHSEVTAAQTEPAPAQNVESQGDGRGEQPSAPVAAPDEHPAPEPAPVAQPTPTALAPAPSGKIDKSAFRLAPELNSSTWLNGAPTTLAQLRGQVVLVDFWTSG